MVITGSPSPPPPHSVVVVSEEHSSTSQGGKKVGVACSDTLGVVSTAREGGELASHISFTREQILQRGRKGGREDIYQVLAVFTLLTAS